MSREWTPKQIELYRALSLDLAASKSWRERARRCFKDATFSDPATSAELEEAQRMLGVKFTPDLLAVYQELGGITARHQQLVMPLAEMVKTNEEFRTAESFASLYMPFDHLLFFGAEGGGNLYAHPIMVDGTYGTREIFEWNHENDSRGWRASGLRDLLARVSID